MTGPAIIILAAGLGKRMGGDIPKVLVPTDGKPLILHVLKSTFSLNPAKVIFVVGHKKELVEKAVREGAPLEGYDLKKISFVFQKEQLGTGHAVKSALVELENFVGTTLIVCGDTPLIRPQTLNDFLKWYDKECLTIGLVSFRTNRAHRYGRVVREKESALVKRIVETKDCTSKELLIEELNSGLYAVDSSFLGPAIAALSHQNAQGEYYLTDIVQKAYSEGQKVDAFMAQESEQFEGVNDYHDLAVVNAIFMQRRIRALLECGVHIIDPASVWIDASVEIAPGATIGPNVQIRGSSKIARAVVIEGTSVLINTVVEEGALIKLGVRAEDTVIGSAATVGPFAHLRPGTVLEKDVRIGNFVETKKAHLKTGSKANHLTYLGDAEVGAYANVGAGTITCNYDGYNKHKTVIGEGAFIGSNTALVAPVIIGDGATVGAGSVITKKVEKDCLAFTRGPQVSKPGWSKAKREREKKSPATKDPDGGKDKDRLKFKNKRDRDQD